MGDYISWLRSKVGTSTVIVVGVCGIIIDEEGAILLQKRSDNAQWGLPGGLMEIGECAMDTLKREIKEELGVVVRKPEFFGIYTDRGVITYANGNLAQPLGIMFTCSILGKIEMSVDETLEVKFFKKQSLPENIFSVHLQPIKDYFSGKKCVCR